MNGGMDYPPGFRRHENPLERLAVQVGRRLGGLVNMLFPGKRRAHAILVANQRTRQTLPRGVDRRPIIEIPENGVDLPLWRSQSSDGRADDGMTRFVFLGRLVDWKAVDLLLEAWARALSGGLASASLEIIGDGPMLASLKAQCQRLGLAQTVHFAGWQAQPEAARRLAAADVLVLPSLLECGGAVVLEAMAAGLAVIAANWGGPTDYVDESCGILIAPTEREAFVDGFAGAMRRLADSPELRKRLGEAGRKRVAVFYDWERKAEQIVEVYEQTVAAPDVEPVVAVEGGLQPA
jgi:glycosyltransferase involved in cell wall biosynthesis